MINRDRYGMTDSETRREIAAMYELPKARAVPGLLDAEGCDGRIAYRKNFTDVCEYRYFKKVDEARRARDDFRRAGYIFYVQFWHYGYKQWETV